MKSLHIVCASLLTAIPFASAGVELNVTDTLPVSIKAAASTLAFGLIKYYTGNVANTPTTIGILPKPLYWWEAGALWGAMLGYYHYTNDSSYNAVVTQALLSQVGPTDDFMNPLYFDSTGNDDQGFWGMAAMAAAEQDFPQPTTGSYSWLQLVENLWNSQVARWDTTTCGGGLKWQWTSDIGLISPVYYVYDCTDDTKGCVDQNKIAWTYNAAVFLYGSAVMYNYTNGSSLWTERTRGILDTSGHFFDPYKNATGVMWEPPCEGVNTCDNYQYSFKGYLSRFMWKTAILAPFIESAIATLVTASAVAAARTCSGGNDTVTCGQHWYYAPSGNGSYYDGRFGVGQQMSALETVQGLLSLSGHGALAGSSHSVEGIPSRSWTLSTSILAAVKSDNIKEVTYLILATGVIL
ncbi:glycoside hydrolase family 76 protein [Calycina marina]|uniref:Mannan endo-1,6-alpha-mannosidase n=1 Tax=Calycina marina TaxID=1763456 RepID=A0A9P7YY63_9HELO|nr:glycoside hydrolase family 76 protein [Calycina marina]